MNTPEPTNTSSTDPWADPEFTGHTPDDNHTSDGRCKYPRSCEIGGHLRERDGDPATDQQTVRTSLRGPVGAHIEQICNEAGLGVMVQVFEIIHDRESVTEEDLLALTADDVLGFYEGHLARAIDTIESFIENP